MYIMTYLIFAHWRIGMNYKDINGNIINEDELVYVTDLGLVKEKDIKDFRGAVIPSPYYIDDLKDYIDSKHRKGETI